VLIEALEPLRTGRQKAKDFAERKRKSNSQKGVRCLRPLKIFTRFARVLFAIAHRLIPYARLPMKYFALPYSQAKLKRSVILAA
jgi:hypothetical protein